MSEQAAGAAFEVDLSNLNTSEDEPLEGLDVDAEFRTEFTPMSDGEHLVRLSFSERKPKPMGKVDEKTGKTNYMVFVDGVGVGDTDPDVNKHCDDILTTTVMKSGACSAVEYLKKVAKLEGAQIPRTAAGIIKAVAEHLAGNPVTTVETQWQTRLADNSRIRGMKRHKTNGADHYEPLREDPKTGEAVYTRAQIIRYIG